MEDIEPSVRELLNQGAELSQTANSGQAGAIIQSALEMAEANLAPDHPMIALCLNTLGEWHRTSGRYAEAEPILRRALAIDEAACGPDHPETAVVLNNLALVLRRTDRLTEAEALFRRALAIFEASYGLEDVRLAGTLNNLAQVLDHTDRPGEAESLMLRSLKIFAPALGASHPAVAIAMNNLAGVMERTGRMPDAERYSRRHVQIFLEYQDQTGQEHAHLKEGIGNYFSLLQRAGLDPATAETRVRALLAGQREDDLDAAPAGAPPDFDRLAKNAYGLTGDLHAKELLFANLFRQEKWHFIARGELPNVQPYAAGNAAWAEGKPMLKAFTDTARLAAASGEWGLRDPDGSTPILSLKVATILPTLDALEKQGVWGIHFNGNQASESFYAPVPQMTTIRERIAPYLA